MASCGNSDKVNLDLIPYPDEVNFEENFSKLQSLSLPEMEFLSQYKPWLESLDIPIKFDQPTSNVSVEINNSLAEHTYQLSITDNELMIEVNRTEDFRNAMVTVYQIWKLNKHRLVNGTLMDKAEFDYRGMHLDVCRHFFPVSDIKKYIDYLTFYKYSKFHWHLTEDQGWRIEIKKYPKLQEIAAYRKETLIGHYNDQPHQFDGEVYGGFYTQEEVKEIVAYATARGIDVIPEIEMPGHAQAALAAYPELGCENKEIEVATKWGVFPDVYCPTETTFTFLEGVLDEVTALFPYEFLHIGGDECPKDAWKKSAFCQNLIKEKNLKDEHGLQSYFIGRMADYLKTKNKTIIGWDEILEGGLNEGSIVMSWRGTQGGIDAAKEGHKVIMTPGSHCYFDHYQSSSASEPIAIGGLTTVKDVYHYEVIPEELSKDEGKLVWGAQGNVWTEYIKDFHQVEYMAMARMTALSEVLHNNIENRDYLAFQSRLASHTNYWTKQMVNFADHQLNVQIEAETKKGIGSFAKVEADFPDLTYYCIDPQGTIKIIENQEMPLTESGVYAFYTQYGDRVGGTEIIEFEDHLATKASIRLAIQPSKTYPASGASSLINGVKGSNEKYGGPEWMGFSGDDFEATIEFAEENQLSDLEMRFFNGEGQWIYLPSGIEVYGSKDGKDYNLLAEQQVEKKAKKVVTSKMKLEASLKFLKIKAKNHGIIADGKQGAGHKAWLFVDEIIVN